MNALRTAIWNAGYTFEEKRQSYAAHGQLFRQAGACIALAVLRALRRI